MRNKLSSVFLIALISTLFVNVVCLSEHLWLSFERRIYDLKYYFNLSEEKNDDIVIIDIDEKSLKKLGRYQNWPRAYFAEVIDYLVNVRALGLDILFAEPDTLPQLARKYFTKPSFDSLLEQAIKKNGKVVVVSTFEEQPIFTEFNKTGAGKVFADEDGIVRRGFYSLFGQKTFAAEIAEMVRGEVDQEDFLIYFLAQSSFRKISFSDVYLKRVPIEYFKDKIVLVGGTAPGLFDFHSIPSQRHFPGLLIQANLINDFINNLEINEIPYIYVILLTFILALIFACLVLTKQVKIYVLIGIALYVLFVAMTFLFFSSGIELGIIRPSYAFLLTVLGSLIYRYRFEESEKRKIKAVFSRYYSKELVEKVIEHPPELGGEKVDCTIVFADIRNFTPYAEKTDPASVAQRLNSFLDQMVQIVFEHHGRIDKFIGDCVMAVFGSPVKVKNHALNACRAALDMTRRAQKLGFRIGIGINSGDVLSGNFGSPMRMEYTVIGDAVNLASRLEGVTKQFDCSIVLGPDTYALAITDPTKYLQFKELGKVKVKGKEAELTVYTVAATIH